MLKTVKVSELTIPALNHMVGVAKKLPNPYRNEAGFFDIPFATSWGHGGPVMEAAGIVPTPMNKAKSLHGAFVYGESPIIAPPISTGPTPLVAGMRCFVVSELGDEVQAPEKLLCA